MKRIHLLYYLFIGIPLYEPVTAQGTQTQSKAITISVEDASKHIGSVVRLNCEVYKAVSNGQALVIYMNTKSPERALMLTLTGESREKILSEMRIRRHLNREIKQPLDTSITATGKIILYKNHLHMMISKPPDIYLGAYLKVQ